VIVVVGLSHKTAPVDVREKLAASPDLLPAVLARMAARKELKEVVFLSTCNRVEVFATADGTVDSAVRAIREEIAAYAGTATSDELIACLYERSGDEAVRHIFRVAASLDSMVLGEPQILGQVKAAHDAAATAGTIGSFLGRCVARAFTVAKRVRTETALGAGTVSISSVAVELAKRIFGDLSEQIVLLVGAGEMAEAAAKSLGKGARGIRVCNRSFERGAILAQGIGADVARWEHLEQELAYADVVVTSTASPTYVVTRDLVKRVMKARKGRTLFLIDIAVPRNVEPTVHTIDNVYVFNVDDLEQQVAEGLKSRQGEVAAAEAIVAAELREFEAWAKGLNVQPAIVGLRAKTRAVLMAELERSLSSRLKHLGDGDRAALSQMMESAVNKLLHAPSTRLKAGAGADKTADLVKAVTFLFDLPEVSSLEERGREGHGQRQREDTPTSQALDRDGDDRDEDDDEANSRLPN
jgi:glutamyl-tRNA reductase